MPIYGDGIQVRDWLYVKDHCSAIRRVLEAGRGHDRRYAIDVRKLENELGWKPAETFESGIRKTVQWYLANPEWVANMQSGAYRDWVQTQYAGGEAPMVNKSTQ